MERIEDLRAEMGELLDVPFPDADDVLLAQLVEVHRAQSTLLALKVRLMGEVGARGAHRADGSKSVAGWLARACHASKAEVQREERLTRRLRKMPETTATLPAGDIGEEHALVLGKLAASPRKVVADSFPEAETALVGYAKTLYYDDFLVAVKAWENAVDQDGAEADADKAHDRRRVHLSPTLDGTFVLDGQFEAVPGTELHTALTRVERELFEADWAAAKEANGGDDPTNDQIERTPAQRRADALVEMARRATAMPKGARKPEPLVTVVVGLETLTGRVCELFNKRPVTPGQVARVLEGAQAERVVFEGRSRVIEVGKRTRFFTGGLRRAIEVRDRHCQHPGCRRPAEWCQVDHIEPHGWGGETVQSNGRLLCEHHNRWRVTGGRPKPGPKPKPSGDEEEAA
jgi:hypothetical protein